jgi:hypothetical protein
MGQLYEQIPHCTQRAASGTTCPEYSAVRRVASRLNIFKNDTRKTLQLSVAEIYKKLRVIFIVGRSNPRR